MDADSDRLNSKLTNATVIDLAAAREARDNAAKTWTAYTDPTHVTFAFVALFVALFFFFAFRRG